MTINWFSTISLAGPFALASAVLPALARKAKIIWWTDEPVWPPGFEQHAELRQYDPAAVPWGEINSADATVYYFGPPGAHHDALREVYRQHPGIVIFEQVTDGAIGNPPGAAFADDLLQAIEAARAARPREAIRWVSGRAGQAMKPWFTDKTARILVPRLARAMSSLFDERDSVVRPKT